MKLVLVIDPEETVPWYRQLLGGLCRGLDNARADWRVATRAGLTVEPGAIYLLTRHTLYDLLPALPERSAVLFEQEIYSASTLVVDPGALAVMTRPAVRLVTTCSAAMADRLRQTLGEGAAPRVAHLGFPYHNAALPAVGQTPTRAGRPKLAVFPQAVRESNCPAFAVELARHLIAAGWSVTFAMPGPAEGRYPLGAWGGLGISLAVCDQPELYALLRLARAAVSTSTSGAVGVAMYEAWRLGAKPVCPRGDWGDPPFFDPYAPTYPLFDARAALALITDQRAVAVDHATFDPDACTARLLAHLEG